jgi:hypothetical protein
MTTATNNYFAQLNKLSLTDLIERKGQFSYLSWSNAVAKLREFDSAATWEVKRFDGRPYLQTELGVFVEVAVTVQGITLSQIHPVLDSKNRPISIPNAFEINTSIQRCLTKAIGLHGIGLSLWSNEDIPEGTGQVESLSAEQQAHIRSTIQTIGGDLSRLLAYFKVNKLEEIAASEYDRVLRSLSRGKKAA